MSKLIRSTSGISDHSKLQNREVASAHQLYQDQIDAIVSGSSQPLLGTPTDGDLSDGAAPLQSTMTKTDAIDTLNETIKDVVGTSEDSLDTTDLVMSGIATYSGKASGGPHNFVGGVLEAGDDLVGNLILADASWNLTPDVMDVPKYSTGIDAGKANSVLIPEINGVEDSDTIDLKTISIVDQGAPFTPVNSGGGKITVLRLEKYKGIYVRCEARINMDTAYLQKGVNEIALIQRIT